MLPLELVRGQAVEAAVRAHGVVVLAPGFDDDDSLLARSEPFERQALVAQLAIEAFVSAVLPGLARIAQRRGDAGLGDPFQDGVADEFGAVVNAE